jgi:hypothetical protein
VGLNRVLDESRFAIDKISGHVGLQTPKGYEGSPVDLESVKVNKKTMGKVE